MAETTAPYIARPLADIPSRVGRPRSFDETIARAALEIISVEGQTITDGLVTDKAAAQKAAALAKRLVGHVAPAGMKIRTRVYESGDGFEWAVNAVLTPAEAPAKAAKK